MSVVDYYIALGGGDGSQDFVESLNTMRWKCDCFGNGVHQSAGHHLQCGPGGVTFFKFFGGQRFLSHGNVGEVQRAENLIKSLEQELFDHSAGQMIALDQPVKIINVNISVAKGTLK